MTTIHFRSPRLEIIISLLPTRFIVLLMSLATCASMILFLLFNDNDVGAQQAQPQPQQTSLGAPIVLIPAITGNILAIVSFLIGTSWA